MTQAILSKIAGSFHFELDQEAPLEKQKDFCMEQVLKLCTQSKWEYSFGCEEALSELTDSAGRSVLVRAVELGDGNLCRGFVSRRIAVLVVNADGDTAIHIAARSGHIQCIYALSTSFSLDKKNLKGETAYEIIAKSKKVNEVYNRLEGRALSLFTANRFAEALEIYRQIHFILEKHFSGGIRQHTITENMICCLMSLKRIDEALDLMHKNFPWKQSFYGGNSLVMAETWTSFGLCYLENGKYEDALEKFEKSLQVWKTVRRENDLDMVPVLNSIAVCYMGLGKYPEAIKSIEQRLAIMRQQRDNNDPLIAESLKQIEKCKALMA